MKMTIRMAAAAITLAGALLLAPTASAAPVVTINQQLGWNSSLSAICLDAACSSVRFTLQLNGLKPTDNAGNLVPASILALGNPGFVKQLSINTNGANGTFSNAQVTSVGSWITNVTGGGFTIINSATAVPLPPAPIVIIADFTPCGGPSGKPTLQGVGCPDGTNFPDFTYSGLAYLKNNTASTTVTVGKNLRYRYRQGDFRGGASAVPEPISMTLLATGLVGVGLARRRKHKSSDLA